MQVWLGALQLMSLPILGSALGAALPTLRMTYWYPLLLSCSGRLIACILRPSIGSIGVVAGACVAEYCLWSGSLKSMHLIRNVLHAASQG